VKAQAQTQAPSQSQTHEIRTKRGTPAPAAAVAQATLPSKSTAGGVSLLSKKVHPAVAKPWRGGKGMGGVQHNKCRSPRKTLVTPSLPSQVQYQKQTSFRPRMHGFSLSRKRCDPLLTRRCENNTLAAAHCCAHEIRFSDYFPTNSNARWQSMCLAGRLAV